jgi:hypothetical protein
MKNSSGIKEALVAASRVLEKLRRAEKPCFDLQDSHSGGQIVEVATQSAGIGAAMEELLVKALNDVGPILDTLLDHVDD